MSAQYELGERVIAAVNGSGRGRAGVVAARIDGVVANYMWNGVARYMVRFDGDQGHSGPCVVIRAEGEREAVPPLSETGD